MRFLLLLLLFPESAFSQSPRRTLKDLMWIPYAGRIYGVTDYSWDSSQVNINKTTEVDIQNEVIRQTVGFGLTDLISFDFTYAHQIKGERESFTTGGGRTTIDTEGTQNPTVAGTWRLMEQAAGSYAVDVRASFLPDLVDREASKNNTEVSAGAGGAVYQVGARLGQKNGMSHWNVTANILYAGESDFETTSGDKEITDSIYTLQLIYRRQEQMLDFLDFRGEVSLQRTSGYAKENVGSDDTKFDPQWQARAGARFLIIIVNDTFGISPGVSMFYATGQDAETGATTQKLRDFKGYSVNLTALYQF